MMYSSQQVVNSVLFEQIPEINFECADGKAMQLVRIRGSQFELVPETVQLIEQLEGQLAICSIAGKMRTGKSFLLNRILGLSSEQGFTVSDKVDACTKGLWIWSKPVYNDRQNVSIIFMDTEGLDSLERDADVDAKLFSLTVLLASFFMYNSVGSIDENAISSLALVAQLIRTVTVTEGDEAANEYALASYAPKFLWLLRDFVLEVRDMSGRKVSSQMYLESSLSDMPVLDSKISRGLEQNQRVRSAILSFFRNRDCLTMVRPAVDERDVRQLQFLPDSRIRPEFMTQVNLIKDRIWKQCSPKIINGVPLTGPLFANFLAQFADAFSRGKIPAIGSAWSGLLETELRAADRDALAGLANSLSRTPARVNEVQAFLLDAKESALKTFSRASFVEDRAPEMFKAVREKLVSEIDRMTDSAYNQSIERARLNDEELLANLYSNFVRNTDFSALSESSLAEKLNSSVLAPFAKSCEGDGALAAVGGTPRLSQPVLAAIVASFDRQADAIRNQITRDRDNERAKVNLDYEKINHLEALLNAERGNLARVNSRLQELNRVDDSGIRALQVRRTEIMAKTSECRQLTAQMGKQISDNRALILQLEKKKKGLCG